MRKEPMMMSYPSHSYGDIVCTCQRDPDGDVKLRVRVGTSVFCVFVGDARHLRPIADAIMNAMMDQDACNAIPAEASSQRKYFGAEGEDAEARSRERNA